jgi:tRNA threonylcarbamoyl adenosine modification protein YeaZ
MTRLMNTPTHTPHQSINILAFDTSGDEASVALWASGKMRSISLPFGTGSHSQAACLVPMIQELLRDGNVEFQDLHVIATPTGPGSFTGIRLGLATAHGLILSLKAGSFTPTTFHLFAFDAWKERCVPISPPGSISPHPFLVTLTTKRDSFYTQAFENACVPLGEASIQTEDEIQNFLVLNPDMYRVDRLSRLSAEILIHFYFYKLETNPDFLAESQETLHPYYLHNPDFAKQKLCSL